MSPEDALDFAKKAASKFDPKEYMERWREAFLHIYINYGDYGNHLNMGRKVAIEFANQAAEKPKYYLTAHLIAFQTIHRLKRWGDLKISIEEIKELCDEIADKGNYGEMYDYMDRMSRQYTANKDAGIKPKEAFRKALDETPLKRTPR